MKNSTIRRYVDIIMYVALCFVTGSGLLIGYRLAPCSRGGDHGMTLWGLGRHDWGTLHLWCAYLVLALLIIHLFLNFAFIKSVVLLKSRLFLVLSFIVGAAIIIGFLLVPLNRDEGGSSCGSSCRSSCGSSCGKNACPSANSASGSPGHKGSCREQGVP